MVRVHVSYYALLREQRGVSAEEVETSASNARQLYDELRERHRFTLPGDRLRLAVNGEFADWSVTLEDGQRLALIPPVAGG